MKIPQANPAASVQAHRAEIDAAIARVLNSGQYILGPEVEAFEHEFAAFIGAPQAVAVASGTEALWLALKSLALSPGDEVITVSWTATATVAAIVEAGATPVFIDVDPGDLTMDPDLLGAALSKQTRAIVPVHLYGQAARLREICALADEAGVPVIEDCAQAHGARCENRCVGTWGLLGAFSFYPTKNLGALGDGGMIVTADPQRAERLRQWREHGWQKRFVSGQHGWNSRLDEIQAAILRVKLSYLAVENARRTAIADAYRQALANSPVRLPRQCLDRSCVHHQFVARHPQRDRWREQLAAHGIGTAIHYPVPVHLQPAYQSYGGGPGSLPVTEQAAVSALSLPIYPQLSDEEVMEICNGLRAAALMKEYNPTSE